MASDYGDESGEKMLDNFTRFGERMGVAAMQERSSRLQKAFENAKKGTADKAAEETPEWVEPREWAKLDMTEFKGIEGYEEIKEIIETKLRAHGVEPTWFEEPSTGKEYLLFRIADAHEVWNSFDELSKETGAASGKAAEKLKGRTRGGRDERSLEERAADAREAAAALEAERGKGKLQAREPRFQELRSK